MGVLRWIFFLPSFHIVSNERLIGSTIKGVKEFFIWVFSERKTQGKEWKCPYPWVSNPCWSISLFEKTKPSHHRMPHCRAGEQGHTQRVGLLWKDHRWDTWGANPDWGKSALLILFKNTFQLKAKGNHNICTLLLFEISNIIYYGQGKNFSQTLKLFKWNYFTWFSANAQMVLESNNSY